MNTTVHRLTHYLRYGPPYLPLGATSQMLGTVIPQSFLIAQEEILYGQKCYWCWDDER